MRKSVDKQLRQREAVSAALSRQKVHITSKRFRDGQPPLYRVLIAGQYYDVGDTLLDRLRHDVSPRELELEPVEDENPDPR